ncbi:MAG: HD domain-containing protein [Bacteroidales bacterium]|jgi:GTP pyrophosphokinase|nr:HD domain-containing protein [Bacteroidales bacterium]
MYIVDEQKERKEILKKYRNLIHLASKATNKEKRQIRKAFTVALNAHSGVRRKGGEPYIYHPMEVARIAAQDLGLNYMAIVCSLLHDVVEDTEYTLPDIESIFGEGVAYIIDGLTKADHLYNEETESLQAETFVKVLTTISHDTRVILIKLCDRLHNLRTIDIVPETSRLKTISETQVLYIPLAERLGLYQMKSEMEDLVTKYNNAEKYNQVKSLLEQTTEDRQELLANFIAPIKQEIASKGYKATYSSRVKSITSIIRKMDAKDVSFEEVYDKFAIRIVLDTVGEKKDEHEACLSVYNIVTKVYEDIPWRYRNWLSRPKDNGYEALHTTVMFREGKYRGKRVEVQIRTRRMDEIAENGLAAHYKYKFITEGDINESFDQWLSRLREVLDSKDDNSIDFMKDLEINIKGQDIIAFTPRGRKIRLPYQATVLDFAFAVHTDLGLKCMGAKINYNVYPIDYVLHSSDQVEIITSSVAEPSPSWLKIVKTSKARKSIQDYFLTNNQILAAKRTDNSILEEAYANTDTILIDKDWQHLHYHIAHCCSPMQGDSIVGLKKGNVIHIHRLNCSVAETEMSVYGNRIIKAKWRNNENVTFLAGIKIAGIDRKGLLQELTGVVSHLWNVNIREVSIKGADGVFEGKLNIYVSNTTILQKLIDDIERLEGVTSVSRI